MEKAIPFHTIICQAPKPEVEIAFNTDLYDSAEGFEFVVEVSLEGRHSSGAVKVTLMREA